MTIHRDGLYCVTLYYIGQHCIAMVYNVDSTLQWPLQLRGLQVVGAHEWSTTILVVKSPYIVIRMVMMIMMMEHGGNDDDDKKDDDDNADYAHDDDDYSSHQWI